MKRNIFIKCFLIALLSLLILFTAGISAAYFSNKKLVTERLVTETRLASAMLGGVDDLSRLDIFGNREECRITIISQDGEVIYESDTGEQLENHIDREEVKAALSGSPRAVERYSETLRCKMAYYAVKTELKDFGEVVLRIAIHSAQINDYILSTLPFLIAALLLSAVIAAVFANKLSKNVAAKIGDIAKSLKSVNDGTYMPLRTDMSDSEFYAVYDEINLLSISTLAHILSEEREREKLNAVLDNISQGIIALTSEQKTAFINKSALKLFSKNSSVISKELIYLIDDSALLESILSAEKNSRFERSMNERILQIEVIQPNEPLRDEIASLIIISDITAQKELARQKEEFFANASHELKTPLTAMLGLTELAMAKNSDESIKKQLERIHTESLRLSDLISDMLKLSQLEDMRDKGTAIKVRLDSVAREVVCELSESIRAKELEVNVSGEASVLADEKRMYELLQNLISNAVNYNKQGGRIGVSLEETSTNTILRVRDTGIGIAKENIPHLCERFYRVDKSRSKKTGGTGLGLAIVKHICALYGAQISISSEIDVGTEFTVVFKT